MKLGSSLPWSQETAISRSCVLR